MITSTKIYSRDTKGGLRYWFYDVEGSQWRGHSGIVDGTDTASGWTQSKAKNPGKKNARTPEEQAASEAENEYRKKLDREYRRTPEELDSVPPAPMLAQKIKDLKKPLRFHPGGYIRVQPKLDGIRMMTRDSGGFSREFQPFATVEHITEALAPVFKKWPDTIFDGELYNHIYKADFNAVSSLVRKGNLTDEDRAKLRSVLQYHVYDLPSVQGGFSARSAMLHAIANEFDFFMSPIVIVPTFKCDTLEEAHAHRDRFIGEGYEGMMWRTDEPYEFGGRSWSLMKDKDSITEEFPFIRFVNGEGNWDGIPKAVEYMLPGDRRNEKGERPKAGIKGDMDFCRSLIDRKPKFITLRYFALTPAGIPRFPVAIDFHDGARKD
jgi:DNA ligase-1